MSDARITKHHNEASRWTAMVCYFLCGENISTASRLTGHHPTTIKSWVRSLSEEDKDVLKKLAIQQRNDVTSEMVQSIRRLMLSGVLGCQFKLIDRIHTLIPKMSANQASTALKVLNDFYRDERDTAMGNKGMESNGKTSIADEILKLAGLEEAAIQKQKKDYTEMLKDTFDIDTNYEFSEEEEDQDNEEE